MKTIINIPDEQMVIINQVCKEQHISRAELIRQAISLLISQRIKKTTNFEKAFGILHDRKIDGLVRQKKLRNEWQ